MKKLLKEVTKLSSSVTNANPTIKSDIETAANKTKEIQVVNIKTAPTNDTVTLEFTPNDTNVITAFTKNLVELGYVKDGTGDKSYKWTNNGVYSVTNKNKSKIELPITSGTTTVQTPDFEGWAREIMSETPVAENIKRIKKLILL